MIDKKKFKSALAQVFSEAGYVSRGKSWYLSGPDAVVVVSTQKSDFDDKYYLNISVCLKKAGIAEFPKDDQCQIQARITSLFPEQANVFEMGSHISLGSDDDLTRMVGVIRSDVIPFLNECLSEHDLKSAILGGRFKRALITKIARDIILSSSD